MNMEAMGKMASGSCSKTTGSISALRPSHQKWSPRRMVIGSPSASSNKSVFLHKWWLEKVNDKDLAVGGFTQKDQRFSLFRSAAIIKRHDTTTLETADGMTVMFSGLIDQLRTNENGYPNEVCHRFMLGFPLDWENYRNIFTRENLSRDFTSDEHKLHSGDFSNDLSSISLDDVPVARIRDLMFGLGDSDNDLLMKTICNNLLKELGKTPQGAPANTLTRTKRKTDNRKGAADEKLTKRKFSSSDEQPDKDEERFSSIENDVKEGPGRSNRKSKAAASATASSGSGINFTRGVSTRSMTRLWRLRSGKEVSNLVRSLP